MLLKFSLIAAILIGLASFGLVHTKLAGKIATLTTERDNAQTAADTAQNAETKAKAEAKAAKAEKDKTEQQLSDTMTKLETETTRANTQEARAARAETELNKTRGEFTEAQRELTAWKALGRPVDQIEKDLLDLKKATAAVEALNEEKKVMVRRLSFLDTELSKYRDPKDRPPDLPAGLKGKVIAVDPKWDFVVLDIGGNQGVVERGELLVNRDGRLVAKVKVASVDADRCIANVMSGWKQAEIMEGDQVVY
jgi:hypothetical protein